jgi:hypothetical protein
MENGVYIGEGTYCVSGAWWKEGTIYVYSITLSHSFQENNYTEYVFTFCVMLRHPNFYQAMNYENFVAYIWVNTVNPFQRL